MLDALCFKNAIISGANNIANQKNKIDDLNIFPVPDGDTGSNMSLTILSAKTKLNSTNYTSVSEVAKEAASAMLRGARGNSGVILSLIFRGFSEGLRDCQNADGEDLVRALGLGVDAAYKAVMKPTEGTILTVARMAYEAAKSAVTVNPDPVVVWKVVCTSAEKALELTPQYLPVLKKAGVVDAGGMGLCVIFKGMLSVFENNTLIEISTEENNTQSNDLDEFRSAAAEFDEVINFTYCTEFIISKTEDSSSDAQELRTFLETIGDCVVVVEDDEIIKVHVHTEAPGDALQNGLKCGQLISVKVENMKEQHKNAKNKSEEKQLESFEIADPTEEYGFVAVASGKGFEDLFKELGCIKIVNGGQSMNPSTDDIHDAIMQTPAKTVFVFPNNKNIVMAAQQTIPLITDRKVIVLPTATVPQGVAALLAFDDSLSCEENKERMIEVAKETTTCQLTYAARDSEFGTTKIKQGDLIGLINGKLTIKEKSDKVKGLIKLIKEGITKDTSFINVFYGEDVSEEEIAEAEKQLLAKFGSKIDVNLVYGGQPIYYFVASIEK